MSEATLTLKADIRDLTRQLKAIPGITEGEAKRMTIALEKELKKQTQLAQEAARAQARAAQTGAAAATTSLGATRAAAFSLQQQLLDIGTGLAGGQSPLTILAQQGPQVATALAQGGGAAATLRAALAPLAGAVGAVGTAVGVLGVALAGIVAVGSSVARVWVDYNEESLRARERSEELATALDAARVRTNELAHEVRGLRSAADEAELQLGILTGTVDKYGAEADKASAAARRNAEAGLSSIGREIVLTKQRLAQLDEQIKGANLFEIQTGRQAERQREVAALTSRLVGLERSLEEGRANLARQNAAIQDAAEYKREEAAAAEILRQRLEAERAAKESAADAARRLRDEEAKRRREAEEAARAAAARADAEGRLVDAFRSARFEAATAEEQVRLRLAETTAEIEAQIEAAGFSASAFQYGEAAKVQAALNAEAEIAAIRQAAAEADRERRARELAEFQREQQARVGAVGDTLGALSSLAATYAQAEAEQNRTAALRAFRVSKGLAVAESLINGFQAVTNVQANWAGRPVIAGLLTAAAVTKTAAQVAAIQATKPTFDRGGLIMAGTGDQVQASVLPGEAILNRQAVARVGEDGVRALNQGASPTPQIVVTPVLDTGRWVRAELQRPSVLARALKPAPGSGRRGY